MHPTPLTVLALAVGLSAQEPADIVLRNGAVYTMDEAMPWARTVVVRGNRIQAVLDDDSAVREQIGPDTLVIDLEGKFLLPGFVDAHTHFAGFAAQLYDIDLMQVSDDEALKTEVARMVALLDDGEWLTGGLWGGHKQWLMGWERVEEYRRDRWLPNRHTIDPISPDNPALLNSYDGELYLANTAALAAAGLDYEAVEGMETDEFGYPTGLIYRGSPAIIRIRRITRPKSEKRILDEVRAGFRKMAEIGITEIHDMTSEPQMRRYVQLEDAGELTARVWMRPHLLAAEQVLEDGIAMGNHPVTGQRDRYLRWGAFKAHFDGLMGSHGALLYEPYSDRQTTSGRYRQCTSSSPLLREPDMEKFDRLLQLVAEAGFVTNTHAIGTKGVADLLAAYGRLQETLGEPLDRYRVIHAQTIRPEDLSMFGLVNAIAEVNPYMIEDDMRWTIDRLGPDRERWAYPLKSLLEHGVMLTFGSDVPGAAGATFLNHPKFLIHSAVNRTRPDGTPEGGWIPEQKISVQEALKAYTVNAAYAAFDEDVRGTIAPGKLADLVVLDRNLLEIDPAEILQMTVELTMVDGKIVFQRD
jgi:predicted amidohydrolase YtcJ